MPEISKYIITEKIYNNDKTLVYRGRRKKDNLPVIIKQVNDETSDFTHIFSIRHEYEINQKINSDSIVRIYEIIEKEGSPFLVMEDFGGESLKSILRSKKFTINEFLNISLKIVQALCDIHNSNIVHNDLNPGNIIINTQTGVVKVTDFGMSSILEVDNRSIGNFEHVRGTIPYISPEQTGRMNRPIDYRTDFYSLGITLYELLIGHLPFTSNDELELIYCHLAKEPISPFKALSRIPKIISDIIMKLMEKMAENRYQSAEELKNDLKKCLNDFENNGQINSFVLGKNDISNRFIVSQKLYGRELEIKKLVNTLECSDSNSPKLITVSGYSGVGKSSLVNELRKFIVNQNGFYAVGKFDQLKHSLSYSALIQAFEEVIKQILSSSKSELEYWKNLFLKNIGSNSKIIIDIIPSFELIVGNHPNVPSLNPTEASNRFNFVFQTFVRICCSKEHPLTIFLDDIQWCDLASLKLIEKLLLDSELKNLTLLLSYRDNEVFGAHPLVLFLDNLGKSNVELIKVKLKNLELPHVCNLLKDTLHIDSDEIIPLGELCLNKTEGNPFFLNQFLQVLHKENLISFDSITRLWIWDLKLITNADITDNVVHFMIRKISKLNPEVKELLTLASCIGNSFDIRTLSIIAEKPKEKIYNLLNEALLDGLIALQDNKNNIQWHFIHDRIQQAAYNFVESTNKKELHLKLGRLLLSNSDEHYLNEKLFEILDHYNQGVDLINTLGERIQIAELELAAGIKSKNSIAYDFAANYLKCGISLLDDNSWIDQYDLTLNLHIEAAEAFYLSGNFESMMSIIPIVEVNVKTALDKVSIHRILMQAYAAQGNIPKAIDTGINCFKLLGFNFNRNPSKVEIITKLLQARLYLKSKTLESIPDSPVIKDKTLLSVLSIISSVGFMYYRADPLLLSYIVSEAVLILIKSGNSPEAPFLYGAYGLILCSIGDIDTGYSLSKLALRLLDILDAKEQKSKVYFMNNAFISHWKEPLKDLLPLFKEGYEAGLEVGDLEFASCNGFYYCNKAFYAGKSLAVLETEMPYFIESIKSFNQDLQLYLTQMMCQLVYNLRGKNENPTLLIGDVYDEAKMLPLHIKTADTTSVCSVYMIKLILCYLFDDHEAAALNAELTKKYIDSLKSTVAVPTFYFYASLNALERCKELPSIEQKSALRAVISNQHKMKKWAKHAPMNFLNKYYLVEAEKNRIQKKVTKAIDYYNKAIEFSNKNNLIQDEALSNELKAKLFIEKGDLKLGRFYIEEAHYLYMRWGANAKAKQLKKKYRNIFFTDSEANRLNYMNKLYFDSTSSSSDKTISMDAATIIKATQAISGEIILEDLLKKLTYILVENAGAQKAVYLINENNKYFIKAIGLAETNKIEVLQGCPIDDYEYIPKSLVNYVINSAETVILDRISLDEKFINDPYILEYNPKSILCMPILIKGDVSGLIYLENNLIDGAFSKDRIEILKIISSQIAISMENAHIYKNLENLNNTLERKVEERTLELNESMNKVYSLLDNSGEGFLIFDDNFIIDSEYSSECLNIFSRDISGLNVLNLLFSDSIDAVTTFSMSIKMIIETDDEFRKEMLLSLLPSNIYINKRYIKMKCKILSKLKFMLILTDITHEKELEEMVKDEQKRLKLVVAGFTNKNDISELVDSFIFFIESGYNEILEMNLSPHEKLSEIYRTIHTYKGSFSQFNFISLPKELHKIESKLSELKKEDSTFENIIMSIFESSCCYSAFKSDIKIITDVLGEHFFAEETKIFIDEALAIKLEKIAKLVGQNSMYKENKSLLEAIEIMRTIRFKNIKEMLIPYIDYTYKLAQSLDKKLCTLNINGDDIKVNPNIFSPFIKSLIHVFRNAVDHGIETPDERLENGKNELGNIRCTVQDHNSCISLIIEDDGIGIDTQRIKEKAIDKNLVSNVQATSLTREQLITLIFSDNFSTRDSINELSGRGYGLSAVKTEIEKLGGSINVETSLGHGTKFTFTFFNKEES
ncbi:GAF domain-containing protein [Clostridium chromiireducens]|uniref:histidine kinase n=1 Tax=Clostridium chromiireducens TaxID=225345 RepID=A0A399IT15_9CLOT|nr:AAA family ATPase [Clostridium chromiireducens]RII35687.1 GAF domain-containing protein [Clostridium chromiireducens]